jgi:N-terminal domain of galactosyltransferase/N-terminal region of glycosyl transferase group 7
MLIFLITYRARNEHIFRRKELITLIDNMKNYFHVNLNDIGEYKIIICEQNNDHPFNRGILYNSAFLESEKMFHNHEKRYFLLNVDYIFNMEYKFPLEFLMNSNGVIDIYSYSKAGCICIDTESYKKINGFPNNFYGWGGEDVAVEKRIMENNIPYDNSLLGCGLIIEINNTNLIVDYDEYRKYNAYNLSKAQNDVAFQNGIDNCIYNIDGYGEFHNGNDIYHYLISF